MNHWKTLSTLSFTKKGSCYKDLPSFHNQTIPYVNNNILLQKVIFKTFGSTPLQSTNLRRNFIVRNPLASLIEPRFFSTESNETQKVNEANENTLKTEEDAQNKEGVVLSNYKHPKLVYADSGREMELDIFIPALNLAFEYQGEQHYFHHYLYGPPDEQQRRDKEKKEACEKAGIKLIPVPFWWDGSRDSLAATIHKAIPEIGQKYFSPEQMNSNPIPEEMPPKYQKKSNAVKKLEVKTDLKNEDNQDESNKEDKTTVANT